MIKRAVLLLPLLVTLSACIEHAAARQHAAVVDHFLDTHNFVDVFWSDTSTIYLVLDRPEFDATDYIPHFCEDLIEHGYGEAPVALQLAVKKKNVGNTALKPLGRLICGNS